MNSLDIKIRESLARYLTNRTSFEEFEDWFMPATWEIEKTSNQLAIELTHEIELRISEFTNGHFTEKELREKLGPLTQRYSATITFGTSSSLASYTTDSQDQAQSRHAGTICEVARV